MSKNSGFLNNTVNPYYQSNAKNFTSPPPVIETVRQPANPNTINSDAFKSQTRVQKGEKVTFKEGAGIVIKGFGEKAAEILKGIVTHPVQTALTIGATTLAMSALPLIGIPTIVGASVLTLGFAGISVFKTLKTVASAVQNGKNSDNDSLRRDLKNIGGDTLNLAMTLPFVPKAVKTVNKQIKYGSTIAFNNELWQNLKTTKGLKNKFGKITRENAALMENPNYQSGIDTLQKQLKFDDARKQQYLDLRKLDGDDFIRKSYEYMTEDLGYSTNSPTLKLKRKGLKASVGKYAFFDNEISLNLDYFLDANNKCFSKSKTINALRHELQHFQQSVDMYRTEGLDYLKITVEGLRKRTQNMIKNVGSPGGQMGADKALDEMIISDMDIPKFENMKAKLGTISANSKEAKRTRILLKEINNYKTADANLITSENASFLNDIKYKKQVFDYLNQLTEKEAYRAGDIFSSDKNSIWDVGKFSICDDGKRIVLSNLQTQSLREQSS